MAIFLSGALVDALVMRAAMMVAVSPTLSVCARLEVAHINFLFLFFCHVVFLTVFGLCQLR